MEKTKFGGRESKISSDSGKWENYSTLKLPCLKMLDHYSFPLILTLFVLFIIWKLLWPCSSGWAVKTYFILSFQNQRIFSLGCLRFLQPSGCSCFIVIKNNSCNFSIALVPRRCYLFVASKHTMSGWMDLEKSDLMEGVPARGRGLECDDP